MLRWIFLRLPQLGEKPAVRIWGCVQTRSFWKNRNQNRKSWIWLNIFCNAKWRHEAQLCIGQMLRDRHFWKITLSCECCICAVYSEIIMSKHETDADRIMLQGCIILCASIKNQCAVFWCLGLVPVGLQIPCCCWNYSLLVSCSSPNS